MPIHFGTKMHENRSKPNSRPIGQHKFTRRLNPANAFQLGMNLASQITSRLATSHLLDGANPIFKKRSINKFGPHIQNINRLVIEPDKPPAFIGIDGLITVIIAKRLIKLDHTSDKLRPEQAD